MQVNLPSTIITQADALALLHDLKNSKNSSAVTQISKANPNQALSVLIEELDKMVDSGLVAHVCLAQTPDQDFLVSLVEEMRGIISPNLLLEVSVDPLIVGGMILRTPEHQYDWSVGKILSQTKPQLTEGLIHAS